MKEFAPFLLSCDTCWGVRDMDLVILVGVLAFAGEVDELEDERPPGNDAAASGEKVSADNVLKYR